MVTTPSDWIPLNNEALSLAIDPQGAQLSMLRDATGHELLWNGDPAVWKGRAPVLFPIVGALNAGRYRWQGRTYPLSRHGFARDRRFELVNSSDRAVLFRQRDDAATRDVYPFAFELDVGFRLDGTRLQVQATVRNPGDAPLPASVGFHPALRWPLPNAGARTAHYLEFESDEPAPVRRLDAQGLLTPTRHASPVRGKRLALHDALFTDDVVIFDQLHSRSLIYGAATGARIKVEYPDATYQGLWTKPGAGFICIEPWRGVADPQAFAGEFTAKPGVFMVAPGSSQQLTMTLELLHAT